LYLRLIPAINHLSFVTLKNFLISIKKGAYMTYSDAIIKRLTALCAEKNITINKLATLSGITQSTVDNLMKGKTRNPKLKTLHKLAIGLNMTVSELLDFPEMNETLFDDE